VNLFQLTPHVVSSDTEKEEFLTELDIVATGGKACVMWDINAQVREDRKQKCVGN
jgi:hypothetical protein